MSQLTIQMLRTIDVFALVSKPCGILEKYDAYQFKALDLGKFIGSVENVINALFQN